MSKDLGGHAFSQCPNIEERDYRDYAGMSLRDYMAAHSPIDLDFIKEVASQQEQKKSTIGNLIDALAKARYMYADAMLKERSS